MRWRLGVLHAFLSVLMLASAGCVRRYEEPPITEPHALVKFRVLHHPPLPHTSLNEAVRLDGYDIRLPEGAPTEPRLRTVRVRPHLTRYGFATEYFHTYTTTRTEYVTETYSCGYGTNTQTCTRTVPRTVTDTHHVTDAACETGLSHAPLVGAVYLVQYDFYGAGACAASCYRQLTIPGSSEFQLVPCGPGEPPVEASAGGEVPVTRGGAAPASRSADTPPPSYTPSAASSSEGVPTTAAPSPTPSRAPTATDEAATDAPSSGSGSALSAPRP